MAMKIEGLTEFQKDLLVVAQKKLPKETKNVMRSAGNKALKKVVSKAEAKVKKKKGNGGYHDKFKRGKAFVNKDGETVVRVINSSPHAHLIEYGHRQVVQKGRTDKKKGYVAYKRAGQEVGYTPGKRVVSEGIKDFENSGEFETTISKWIDRMLGSGKL